MKNKVRIVHILRAPIGGIRKHVLDIIESLSHEDIDQIFITNVNDSDIDLGKISQIKNLKIYHLPIVDSPGLSDLINIFSIIKIFFAFGPTVVHGHGAKGGLYSRVVGKLFKAQVFYTPHGGSLHRVFGKLKNKIFDLVEKMLIPFTDLFIFESNYSADAFKDNISKKIKFAVNYNGVEEFNYPILPLYQPLTKLKLASFGLLRHLKGHDIAIDACAILKENKIPFEYTIYGAGEFETTLTEQIKKLNLIDCVHIKKYALNAPKEMGQFHFIIHPSRFESFGYVPAEAMIQGIPVISSHEGGLKEVVDKSCGLIAKNNQASEYADILKKIYSGEINNLEVLKANAINKVKTNFSLNKMLSNLKKYYGI